MATGYHSGSSSNFASRLSKAGRAAIAVSQPSAVDKAANQSRALDKPPHAEDPSAVKRCRPSTQTFRSAFPAIGAAARMTVFGSKPQQPKHAPLCPPPVSNMRLLETMCRSLAELPEEPCLNVFLQLDSASLCSLDAVCRLTRSINNSSIGPWRELGKVLFNGVEIEREGVFEAVARRCSKNNRLAAPIDWKGRYLKFRRDLPTFRHPFSGRVITTIDNPDEVVYCKCMVRKCCENDQAAMKTGAGVYIEVAVLGNPDNVSVALIDFEAGGHSSVTFSPDTGAVIRERKIQEVPRKVEGAYVQPLPALPNKNGGFKGSVGIYVLAGHLAFLRKRSVEDESQDGSTAAEIWESTGFVTDLSWAEGQCITPCLAFRDEGAYHVRMVRVGSDPPLALGKPPAKYDEGRWTGLDWEAEGEDNDDGE